MTIQTMPIQTISFELAHDLKNLGIIQNAYFKWYKTISTVKTLDVKKYLTNLFYIKGTRADAFTLCEILGMLPDYIDVKNVPAEEAIFRLSFFKNSDNKLYYFYFASCQIKYKNISECSSQNPAEAAGQLLKWCIENNYVKVEDLKWKYI